MTSYHAHLCKRDDPGVNTPSVTRSPVDDNGGQQPWQEAKNPRDRRLKTARQRGRRVMLPAPSGPGSASGVSSGRERTASGVALSTLPKSPPRPSSALPSSLGTIHSLFAPPWAISGSISRYL